MLALPLLAHASLPQSSNVPGGIAIVPLGGALTNASKPLTWFGDQAVLVTSDHKIKGVSFALCFGISKLTGSD